MFKRMIVLGFVFLAAVAVALMPCTGNFSVTSVEDESARIFKSTETSVQVSAPKEPIQSSEAVTERVDQTLTQPVIETVSEPIYASVTIVPEEVVVTVDTIFRVEIWINNVTGMGGWQISLLWNKEVIKCVEAQINTPIEWGGMGFDWFNKTAADVDPDAVYTAWLFGSGIENDYNDTCGRYLKGECYGPCGGDYHETFSGSIPVVVLTFQALKAGTTFLSLSRTGYKTGVDFIETEGIKIADQNAEPIAHFVYNGFVEVQAS